MSALQAVRPTIRFSHFATCGHLRDHLSCFLWDDTGALWRDAAHWLCGFRVVSPRPPPYRVLESCEHVQHPMRCKWRHPRPSRPRTAWYSAFTSSKPLMTRESSESGLSTRPCPLHHPKYHSSAPCLKNALLLVPEFSLEPLTPILQALICVPEKDNSHKSSLA